MTDLTTFVLMIANSGDEFSKMKSGKDWRVVTRGIE